MSKNTNIIGLKILRENMEKYIAKVNAGHSFVVIRRSKPVFKLSPVDEWGDEGVWKELIDFRKIDKKGVLIEDLLRVLRKSLKKEKNEYSSKVR